MSGTMSAMVLFTSLLLFVSSRRIIGLRRGTGEGKSPGSFLEPDPSRCEEELRIFKRKIQDSCEEDQQNRKTVSDGGCEAEAEAVVSDGDYEVWSQSLVQCGPEKTHLLLWSGYQDEGREEVLRPLRQKGGCVLQSQDGLQTVFPETSQPTQIPEIMADRKEPADRGRPLKRACPEVLDLR
eukprot:s4783_g4.t1